MTNNKQPEIQHLIHKQCGKHSEHTQRNGFHTIKCHTCPGQPTTHIPQLNKETLTLLEKQWKITYTKEPSPGN